MSDRRQDSRDSMSVFFPDRLDKDKSRGNSASNGSGSGSGRSLGRHSSDYKYRHSGGENKYHYSPHLHNNHLRPSPTATPVTPSHNRSYPRKSSRDYYHPSRSERNESTNGSRFDKNNYNKPPISTPESLSKSPEEGFVYDPTNDQSFGIQRHHVSKIDELDQTMRSNRKNYKVMYDPEIKKIPEKGSNVIYRIAGEGVDGRPKDPRVDAKHFKPNTKSKKCVYKSLLVPSFAYDKDSIGPPPSNEIVVWGFPSEITEIVIKNNFSQHGEIKDVKLISHPISGVPLGICKVRFGGSIERSAKNASRAADRKDMMIGGLLVKCGLNDNKDKLLTNVTDSAVSKIEKEKKLRLQKQNEELSKQREQKKTMAAEEPPLAKAATQPSKPKLSEQNKKPKLKARSGMFNQDDQLKLDLLSQGINEPKEEVKQNDYKANTTILSKRHNNKIIDGISIPSDLKRYIKDRPFIVIYDKYIPLKDTSSSDIKKVLDRYEWTRVLTGRNGFYIVFNNFKECERCFKNEDGRKFVDYKMYMELMIPENYDFGEDSPGNKSSGKDVVEEASNILMKELQNFLSKDIRERVIAPIILDLLNPDKYPEIVKELKEKEQKEREKEIEREKLRESNKSNVTKLNIYGILRPEGPKLPSLPSMRKKSTALKVEDIKKPGKRKLFRKEMDILPMQHTLNFVDSEEEDNEVEYEAKSATMSPAYFNAIEEPPKKKSKRALLRESFLSESSSSDESDGDKEDVDMDDNGALEDMIVSQKSAKKAALITPPEDSEAEDDDDEEEEDELRGKRDNTDYSSIDLKFRPSIGEPRPVYEDRSSYKLDFDGVQSILKDDEDLLLAKELFKDIKTSSKIKNLDYWTWKQKDIKLSEESGGEIYPELEEIIETLDFNPKYESTTGASRSEGYRKIHDSDKIEYLPHRRKIHKPLETVQHEEDHNSQAHGNVQSSRVNRANNRRLAADISAQKQMLGSETDILNLNALTKRKKPVQFARSAIHDWGLYALEPIAAKEMIIEYVGESLRQQVAENREKRYLKSGIGSSYLFRIDENTVVDATKMGGIARFINHCCSPSCTAKIIKVEGKKRIVIYALRDIDANEELTYDYKFERETNDEERIRCLCGAPGCKGYLN